MENLLIEQYEELRKCVEDEESIGSLARQLIENHMKEREKCKTETTIILELKELSKAYDIANKFDCVPNIEELASIDEEFYSDNIEILTKYEGYSPYDIISEMKRIINEV
jgi:hypothetical protein